MWHRLSGGSLCVFIKGRKKPVCIYGMDELQFLHDMLTIKNRMEHMACSIRGDDVRCQVFVRTVVLCRTNTLR
jgi:hypothetical protein